MKRSPRRNQSPMARGQVEKHVRHRFQPVMVGNLINNCEKGKECPDAFYKSDEYRKAIEYSGILQILLGANPNVRF